MKHFVYLSFLVIFVSMILILLVFDNFSKFIVLCQTPECSDADMFFTMLFGFFVTSIFVLIDVIVCIVIIKEKPWKTGEAYKSAATKLKKRDKLAALKEELANLNRAKQETEKQYYKGKFDAHTFEKMLNDYDRRIIETKTRIKGIKPKTKSKIKEKPKKA